MAKYPLTLAELEALVLHVNTVLGRDNDLDCMPIKPPQRLYQAQKNGVLFCKLINRIKRGTIPSSKINKQVRNIHQALENQKLVIEGARNIGCEIPNISAEDLWSGREHHVLEILWQIIRVGLLSQVNIEEQPKLALLRKSEEDWAEFAKDDCKWTDDRYLNKLPPEEPLIRWVNHHLRRSTYRGPDMTNFDSSLKDSVIYCYLLHQLAPERCNLSPLGEQDLFVRANKVLIMAELIGCRKYLTAHELVKGNPRLNLAFLANLFHVRPGLECHYSDMDNFRLTEELNMALSRCHFVEEERNVLLQVRREMSEEFKDTRKKLEDRLRELEIIKRKALRLEDENKHLTGVEEMHQLLKAENSLFQSQLDDMKALLRDSQATIKNQEITINSLKTEKEVLIKEYEDKLNELQSKISTISRKQTTMVLQKEALTYERDLLKRKHDKCEAENKRLQTQVDRRQRHVQQLRQLFKSFTSDKALAETLYGKLDFSSLQSINGKYKAFKFCQDGGPSLEGTKPQVFLLKDNFLFVFNSETEEELPKDVFRLDQATINEEENRTLQLSFTQKEISYFIKVSPDSKLKELQQELEASADWWTERTRTSPGSRFKDIVRTNMLTSGVSKTKRNLKLAPFITADI